VYGAVASDHLKSPRNLGKLADADGVGTVDDPGSETLLTIYLKLGLGPDGRQVVDVAQFRAFGCGGCIITGSIATELAIGLPLDELAGIDGAAINRALEDGLPQEQRYCAELAARALHLAGQAATRDS
jgi:nitrogen fixation protein NifU and related proteins